MAAVTSKLYGINATIIISVFFCIAVWFLGAVVGGVLLLLLLLLLVVSCCCGCCYYSRCCCSFFNVS